MIGSSLPLIMEQALTRSAGESTISLRMLCKATEARRPSRSGGKDMSILPIELNRPASALRGLAVNSRASSNSELRFASTRVFHWYRWSLEDTLSSQIFIGFLLHAGRRRGFL